MTHRLAPPLLRWYRQNRRTLPFRKNHEPYAILVSEFMLQQTRMDQVLPYYTRWMNQFPTLEKLAKASERDVLKAWEGLGYYARARNLHATAKEIAKRHNGKIPPDPRKLMELPGIGPYMAGAISSIAFNQNEIAVDGNVQRVVARWTGTTDDATAVPVQKKIAEILRQNLPRGHAREFNQGLMELGALVCTPKKPDCPHCPLRKTCTARKKGIQEQLPVKPAKKKKPTRTFAAAWSENKGKLWLEKRGEKLLQGTFELPQAEIEPRADHKTAIEHKLSKKYNAQVKLREKLGRVQHDYSHFRQIVHLYAAHTRAKKTRFDQTEIRHLPVSIVNQKLLKLANRTRRPKDKS